MNLAIADVSCIIYDGINPNRWVNVGIYQLSRNTMGNPPGNSRELWFHGTNPNPSLDRKR